jgi:hypothetical protein
MNTTCWVRVSYIDVPFSSNCVRLPSYPDNMLLRCKIVLMQPVSLQAHLQSKEGFSFDKMMVSFRSAQCRQRPQPLKSAKMFQTLAQKRMDSDPDLRKKSSYEEVFRGCQKVNATMGRRVSQNVNSARNGV